MSVGEIALLRISDKCDVTWYAPVLEPSKNIALSVQSLNLSTHADIPMPMTACNRA
jgi:hypothetical protein